MEDQTTDQTTESTPDAVKPAPKAKAKRTPKAKVPPAVPVSATGKFKGRGTCVRLGIPAGLRRMEFQDRLLAANAAPAMRKTDLELAAMMDAEHPGGVKIRPDHMRAIRRLYNEGKHTKSGVVPKTPSVAYDSKKAPLVESKGKAVAAA